MKIGLFSDVHDDKASLINALKVFHAEKCDQIVSLGDMIGSSVPEVMEYLEDRNSHDVLDLVKSTCDVAVLGNHDLHAVQKVPSHTGNYKFPKNWYRLDHFSRKEELGNRIWHYEKELPSIIDRQDRLFILGLPELVFKYYENDLGILYTHYAYPDITGVTTVKYNQSRYLEKHFKYMDMHKTHFSFSGHGHINGLKIFNPKAVIDVEFGQTHTLSKEEKSWIVGPAVMKQKSKASGVTILNTQTLEIKAISF